jgi:hypothetical protein
MKIVIFVLGVFLFCTSCSNTDDDLITDETLSGEWVLTAVLCFCGFPEDVDFSLHTLNFSEEGNRVTVKNDSDTYYFHESGTYQFTNTNNTISLEDNDRSYTYQIEADVLLLSYVDEPMIADDEVTYKYARK